MNSLFLRFRLIRGVECPPVRIHFEAREDPWQEVSRPALIGWPVFYALVLLLALTDDDGFLFIDNANLVVHEAGHLLFSYLGETLAVWGGTLFELFVPAALAVAFVFRRHLAGAAFCTFFFFENFLYIATYMADARRQELPLVSVGGGDTEHDWFLIFSNLGVLNYDTTIAGITRAVGWLGMLATIAWFILRGRQHSKE